jgi:hypothetical protein
MKSHLLNRTAPDLLAPARSIIVPVRCPRCGKWRVATRARNPHRYFPRWPTRLRSFNVYGPQINGAGNPVVNATGDPVLADDAGSAGCCCTSSGTPCSSCASGTTPIAFTVTVSGITACSGFTLTPDPNGTYTCPQDGTDPCSFIYDDGTIRVGIGFGSGFIAGNVRYTAVSPPRDVFDGNTFIGGGANCRTTRVISNTYVIGDCGVSSRGYSGSMTATAA